VGQATSPHQNLLLYIGECGEDAGVDRGERRLLVAIVKKRQDLNTSLYAILQILSLTMLETTLLHQMLRLDPSGAIPPDLTNQLNLFKT
jgi:hypothetical protein